MLFNSIDFAVFLPIVFVLYWFVTNRSLQLQNALVLVASYVFYGWWDWRFLTLVAFSTLVDYSVGRGLANTEDQRKRKLLLWSSICVNLGFLGFFKYFNFFQENFVAAFTVFGGQINGSSLNIILPVGISFYTFQTLSYTIDVYNRKIAPSNDLIAFSAFVSFFPQLVAGPIERASHLLPQFDKTRTFDYGKAIDGLRQILWGLFKKVVIADNCAEYANLIFNDAEIYPGSTLFLGAFLFTMQIYGDFSGYSDIAIGTSRLFGFDLKRNFAFPFFSRSVAEHWRRWHISLSTWFRDYVYIPLGGSRGGNWGRIRNTFIIFTISGFWHGASWTFVIWGAVNALFFLPEMLTGHNKKYSEIVAQGKLLPTVGELGAMAYTFTFTILAFIWFRADDVPHGVQFFSTMFSSSLFSVPYVLEQGTGNPILPKIVLLLVAVFMLVEWMGREGEFGIAKVGLKWKWPFRYAMYYAIIAAILWFGGKEQDFIYFQF